MAPKTTTEAQKLAIILKVFHDTNIAYGSKDLEGPFLKLLKSNYDLSLRHEQLKELLPNLIDEGQIRVEKIGSGNWYWSFVSDAKKSKEKILHDLEAEHAKLTFAIADIETQILSEMAAREDNDDEMMLDGGLDRETLLGVHEKFLNEVAVLQKELASYSDSDPTEILRKAEETKKLQESAEKWTDYIESVEGFLRKTVMDRHQVAHMMEVTCGDEYVAGEGLKDM